jgi:hypothetical protein
MTPLALDIRAARTAAERILEELDLGSYVFTVEAKAGGWELSVQCAAGEAWQVIALPVDPAKLRASLDDPAVRDDLRSAWRTHLEPCAKRGA